MRAWLLLDYALGPSAAAGGWTEIASAAPSLAHRPPRPSPSSQLRLHIACIQRRNAHTRSRRIRHVNSRRGARGATVSLFWRSCLCVPSCVRLSLLMAESVIRVYVTHGARSLAPGDCLTTRSATDAPCARPTPGPPSAARPRLAGGRRRRCGRRRIKGGLDSAHRRAGRSCVGARAAVHHQPRRYSVRACPLLSDRSDAKARRAALGSVRL